MFGRKKEPDPAKVAEREAMVAQAKAQQARAAALVPRMKELDDSGMLHTEPAAHNLAQNMDDDETLDGVLWGQQDKDRAMLAATSRRVLLVKVRTFGSSVESIDYSKITGIQKSSGLVFGDITIAAGGSTVEVKKTVGVRLQPFIDAVQANMAKGGKPSSPTAAPVGDDPIEQLRKLAALRDDGIITAEDFETKKRQLLGL